MMVYASDLKIGDIFEFINDDDEVISAIVDDTEPVDEDRIIVYSYEVESGEAHDFTTDRDNEMKVTGNARTDNK